MNNRSSLSEFNYNDILKDLKIDSSAFYNFESDDNKKGVLNVYYHTQDDDTQDDDDNITDLTITEGTIKSGSNIIIGNNDPYHSITIMKNACFDVTDDITFIDTKININGTLDLSDNANLIVNNSTINIYLDADLIIRKDCNIIIDENSTINIIGTIQVDCEDRNKGFAIINNILNSDNFVISNMAVILPININLGEREFSLSDYDQLLRNRYISKYLQGRYSTTYGTIGFAWKHGDSDNNSQLLQLITVLGDTVLGDSKFKVLGVQSSYIPDLQIIESLWIKESTTLYISEIYKEDNEYYFPSLYVGIIPDNSEVPGKVIVDGNIVVDGNTSIILDNNGKLIINENGTVTFINHSQLIVSDATEPVVLINGTLIVDDINQLVGFDDTTIEFGDNGKVIILNKNLPDDTVLLSIPNGIQDSYFYKIFYTDKSDKILHVEYHIQDNTIIEIDDYFDFYAKDMADWYGGMRIEYAVYKGFIIWHNNGMIKLSDNILDNWVEKNTWTVNNFTLLHASRLFKNYSSYDEARLAEVASRLKTAGFGNIKFIFEYKNNIKSVILNMNGIKMVSAGISSIIGDNSEYFVSYNADDESIIPNGHVFIKNKVTDFTDRMIISDDSKTFELNGTPQIFEI